MGVSVRRSYRAAGTLSLSLSRLDIEKPPDDIHRWRRTNSIYHGIAHFGRRMPLTPASPRALRFHLR